MNRGTSMVVVRIAPTRDGEKNPSERMADKHCRLLCGHTLDEWWAMQSWASRLITHSVLVAETPEHRNRVVKRLAELLGPTAVCAWRRIDPPWSRDPDWAVTVIARPDSMNHPTQDSGSFPVRYGIEWARSRFDNINILLTDFVVSPLKRPPDLDDFIQAFAQKLCNPNPDAVDGVEFMTSVAASDATFYRGDGERMVVQNRTDVLNLRYVEQWLTMNAFVACTPRFYDGAWVGQALKIREYMDMRPWRWPVESWQEVHIDTPEEWELAETWFGRRIGGMEAYRAYREEWQRAEVSAAKG